MCLLPLIDIGFNQSEYTLQESEMNHTIPVDITGGRLPIDTIIQVEPQLASTGAGTYISKNMYINEQFTQ